MANGVATPSNQGAYPNGSIYYERIPLKRLVAKTVYYKNAYKESLEKSKGRYYTWTIDGIQTGTTIPAQWGTPIAPTPWVTTPLTATLNEYGQVFSSSSFLNSTEPADVEKMLERQATQSGAYSIDALIRQVITSVVNVPLVNQFYANFRTSAGAVQTTDTFGLPEVRALTAYLEGNNVPTFNGNYRIVIDTQMAYDLKNNTNSNALNQFASLTAQQSDLNIVKDAFDIEDSGKQNAVGDFGGAEVWKTTLQPVSVGAGASGQTLHWAVAFGDQSLAAVDLDAERFRVIKKDKNQYNLWDSADMIDMTYTWKAGFGAMILSQDLVNPINQRVLSLLASTSLL